MMPGHAGQIRLLRPGTRVDPAANALLSSFPAAVLDVLLPRLDSVQLRSGQRLMTLAREVPHVYFPVSCLLTVDAVRPHGSPSHLRVIGSDGMAGGLAMLLGADLPAIGVSVVRAGRSLRVPGAAFRDVLDGSPELQRVLRAYTRVLRGNVEHWMALPGNGPMGAPLLAMINAAMARPV